MEELIEDCVLDDLFDVRTDGFQSVFLKENGKLEEIEEAEQIENELEELIKELIQDEKIRGKILEKLEEFVDSKIGELCFWNREYYKFGVRDGVRLKKSKIGNVKKIE